MIKRRQDTRKSETKTMKLLLLFMFVAVAVATEEYDAELTRNFVRRFNITKEQALECINKTGVTSEDVKKMQDSIDHSENEITDMKIVRTGGCALVCAAQKQGIMVGKQIKHGGTSNYHEQPGIPKDLQEKLINCTRFCKQEVADIEDECMVGYRYFLCLAIQLRTLFLGK